MVYCIANHELSPKCNIVAADVRSDRSHKRVAFLSNRFAYKIMPQMLIFGHEPPNCQPNEHISTALTPRDREATYRRIQARLEDEDDNDWILGRNFLRGSRS